MKQHRVQTHLENRVEDIKPFSLLSNATLLDGLKIINQGLTNVVFIVDDKFKLLGIASDGDIRRGLLQGLTTADSIMLVTNSSPVYVFENQPVDQFIKNLDPGTVVPVVNNELKLLNYIKTDLTENLQNFVLVMAGGFGSRLGDLTKDLPKPMLEIRGKPILEHLLEGFIKQGFINFIFSTYFKANKISKYFGDGNKFGVNICYIHEEKPLGTAGAIGLVDRNLLELPLLVVNGDVFSSVDFGQALKSHTENKNDLTLITTNQEYYLPFGHVIKDNENLVSRISEKPTFSYEVLAGSYIFDPKICKDIRKNEHLDMDLLISRQLGKKARIGTFNSDSYWIDVGMPETFHKASKVF